MELIRISVTGSEELRAKLRDARSDFSRIITTKVDKLLAMIASRVNWRLTGHPVHVRTGVLRASVRVKPAEHVGGSIYGEVQAGGGPAYYAGFVERGTRPHDILATKARALAFMSHGKKVFAPRVAHPGIAGRWFMKETADEFRARVAKEMDRL